MKDESGWYSQKELADIFGVSVTQIQRKYDVLVDDQYKRKKGHLKLYYVRAVIEAYVANEKQRLIDRIESGKTTDDEDTSQGERLKRIRADILELNRDEKREQMKGNLMLRDDIHQGLQVISANLARLAKNLNKKYGKGPHQMAINSYKTMKRQIANMFNEAEEE